MESDEIDSILTNRNSLLVHKESFEITTQYTIHDMGKCNNIESDIEKYAMRKVTSNPINKKNEDLDRICFPHIFPYGRG